MRGGFVHRSGFTGNDALEDLCSSLEGRGGSKPDALLGSFANSSGYRDRRFFLGGAVVRFWAPILLRMTREEERRT